MWSTLSLPLLRGPLWPVLVVSTISKIERFDHLLRIMINNLKQYGYVQIIYIT